MIEGGHAMNAHAPDLEGEIGTGPWNRTARDLLCLAATPTFAIMALLSAIFSDGPVDMLCAADHASMLTGMVPMYVLMSVFHASAWLKLLFGRRA
jgi:hypothetical protein